MRGKGMTGEMRRRRGSLPPARSTVRIHADLRGGHTIRNTPGRRGTCTASAYPAERCALPSASRIRKYFTHCLQQPVVVFRHHHAEAHVAVVKAGERGTVSDHQPLFHTAVKQRPGSDTFTEAAHQYEISGRRVAFYKIPGI